MVRTDEFAKDMCKELNMLLPEMDWQHSWPRHRGYEHVDVAGLPKRTTGKCILVEIELRRKNPVSNVVKIWRWHEAHRFRSKPILFQAFSGFYGAHDTHRKNAEFIGNKMENLCGISYYALDFKYKPREYGKVGAGARRKHAIRLAKRISRMLKSR